MLKGPPLATDVAIALHEDAPEPKAKLDHATAEAAADGTIRRISVKWSKPDVSPGQ